MTDKEIIVTIIIALISNGGLTALVVGIFDVVKKKMDKTSGNAKRLADMEEAIKKIDKKLDEHIAQSYRNKILDFQNECLSGRRHTYEQFNEVLFAITNYSRYVEENDVDNEKCTLAIEYIREVYKNCQTASNFAPMSAQMIGDTELRSIIADVLSQNQSHNHN